MYAGLGAGHTVINTRTRCVCGAGGGAYRDKHPYVTLLQGAQVVRVVQGIPGAHGGAPNPNPNTYPNPNPKTYPNPNPNTCPNLTLRPGFKVVGDMARAASEMREIAQAGSGMSSAEEKQLRARIEVIIFLFFHYLLCIIYYLIYHMPFIMCTDVCAVLMSAS